MQADARIAPILLSITLVGCGNSPSSNIAGDAVAQYVAQSYDKDCRSADAPNPKAAKELDQLCSCMTKHILSTVGSGDKDDVVNRKIDEGEEVCLKQVYPNG